MTGKAKPIDWMEEGKKHFLATQLHPERPCANYPTRDKHSAEDEANFITGFNLAKAEHARGEGLSGMAAYASERDDGASAQPLNLKVKQ